MAGRVSVRAHTRGGAPVRAHTRSAPRGSGVVASALAVGLVLGTGGTAGIGADVSAGTGGSAGATRGAVQVRKAEVDNVVLRLQRSGLRASARVGEYERDCAGHSYEQVHQYFLANPCAGMFRAAIEVRDRRSPVVLVAISWVDMPDEHGARVFHALVDRYGTGNVTELSREVGRYRHVRFTGQHYDSDRDDASVVNTQVQPTVPGSHAAAVAGRVDDVLR